MNYKLMPLKCSLDFIITSLQIVFTPIKHNVRADVCGWEVKLITREQMSQLS